MTDNVGVDVILNSLSGEVSSSNAFGFRELTYPGITTFLGAARTIWSIY
jgi:hypothetical protein